MWADLAQDESYRLANLWPYFLRSTTLTPPNNEIRRANATTLYDPTAFAPIGGPIQVGCQAGQHGWNVAFKPSVLAERWDSTMVSFSAITTHNPRYDQIHNREVLPMNTWPSSKAIHCSKCTARQW